MTINIAPFKKRLRDSLASPNVGIALDRAVAALQTRRDQAFAQIDFPALRERVRQVRADSVRRMPELLAEFKAEAEKVGAVVHVAKDAQEACEIVGRLARERGVTLAVKGKSMMTEEIGLNDYLERQGVKAVETDLGEWIQQLAGETPSHLVMPAIHKTREEVAALFARELGREVPSEIKDLVEVARERLRQSFISAQMGISGANMAIAESGTLLIVTNEGNGRLATTLPPIHVAVVGIEKLVPTLEDAVTVLKALPRSATGQKITSYISLITGPSRTADIEMTLVTGVHGPKEMHIVFIDNGRSALREDAALAEALRCIRCGACANTCPSYRTVGGQAFGYIYNGPIGLVFTAAYHGMEEARGPLSLCLNCGACDQVCPVGIPISSLIGEVRRRSVEEKGTSLGKRLVVRSLESQSNMDRAAALGGLGRLVLGGKGVPHFAHAPLHRRWRKGLPGAGEAASRLVDGSQAAGMRVAYFPGCMTDLFYPELGEAVARILGACAVDMLYPSGQACCGLSALSGGDHAPGLKMAKQTIGVLESVEADYILSSSTSCIAAMLKDYPALFSGENDWRERAGRLAEKLVDFAGFMVKAVRLPPGALRNGPSLAVAYHDTCKSHNALGLGADARHLIRDVMVLPLTEMADASVCCGFGGTFSQEHPQIARRILERKLANLEAAEADIIVADNPGCLLHIREGLRATGRPQRALHIAELMAERL